MPQLTIILKESQLEALRKLAESNLRDPRSQALLIILTELEKMELISSEIDQSGQKRNDEVAK